MTQADPVEALERELEELAGAIEELRAVRLEGGWELGKGQVDGRLAAAQQAMSAVAQRGGTAEVRARIERLAQRCEELARTVRQIPPPVQREAEILAIIVAPLEGGATAGYAQKEALLRAEMEQLSHAESRTLALRIRQASADDPLTAPLQRWTAERRGRIIDFLEDSRRREALRREAELRSKQR
ncbi:MAG: hypothetical protein KF773_20965 [Deltaproteobacteria bacterium]|nr:hypothetical protein [Deltaproteobacteria bacterium]